MRKLYILMNDELVGELLQNNSGSLSFNYYTEWMQKSHTRPISLSLPLLHKKFEGEVVYNFFDNLLPDNPQIRNRIQANFRTNSSRPFDLLAEIGRDCVGAIQIIENLNEHTPTKNIKSEVLSDTEIANILRSYQMTPFGMRNDNQEFRISIAGAQEKMAFLLYDNKWRIPYGTTPTTHIFKLPIGYITHQGIDLKESCENEWLCLTIAKAYGLEVANAEILEFADVKALVVERFDRKFSQDMQTILRLPQEDMCQALGYSPNLKYQADGGPGIKEIMKLLNGSQQPIRDRDNFFKAQIVNWCLGAIDAHAKNFSIKLQAQNQYHLTPLYDMISAYPLVSNKQLQYKKLKMAMALYGKNIHYKFADIQKRHFLETAEAAEYSSNRALTIFNEIMDTMDDVIETVAKKLPSNFPATIAGPIFAGMLQFRNKINQNLLSSSQI